MTELLAWVAVGMATAFIILIAWIVVGRFLADRRRRREKLLRPTIETAIAEYLAAEEPEQPRLPATKAARDLLRMVALETMSELSGRERDRLVALLERLGIVAETAARLGSHRRRVRRFAAEALRQIGSEEAERYLSVGLEDSDLDTSLTCAAALAELSDETLVPPILALADRAALARPGAVAAILVTLGRTHPSTIGDALDPGASLELRRLAAAVAGELRLAEHVPLLREALHGEDDELVARAARGLGAIGDVGEVELLLRLAEAEDHSWFVRLAATDALGAIGDPRAIEPLERELNSDSWLLQAKAAKALRMLGSGGEEALRRALGSPATTVRDQARVALER
jgi:HEAT repeat protein